MKKNPLRNILPRCRNYLIQEFIYKHIWQKKGIISYLLYPCSLLFNQLSALRYYWYKKNPKYRYNAGIPLIIIGNLSIGGTGKTPLVIAMVKHFLTAGKTVGVISRGYGSQKTYYPCLINEKTPFISAGDEPALIYEKTKVPVVIDPIRKRGVAYLLKKHSCDIIISDDGLQHYALERSIEIILIDGARKLGNGFTLPAGPLREKPIRLQSADLCVSKNTDFPQCYTMHYQPQFVYNLQKPSIQHSLETFAGQSAYALAGIANPASFFELLQAHKILLKKTFSYPDHYHFSAKDFQQKFTVPIFITEKDAIKCRDFHLENVWVVAIEAILPPAFWDQLHQKLTTAPTRKA